MKNIYEVTTKRYQRYYVLANGFDEAKKKVENEIIENDSKSILTTDGSLNTIYELDEVENIKCLGSKFLQ